MLSASIRENTSESVSPATLKRLFGYLKPATVPRTSTLSILARYVGRTGWSDFRSEPDRQTGRKQNRPSHTKIIYAAGA